MIPVDEYVAFLDREYAHGYLEDGGAAIKFVVPSDDGSAPVFMESFAAAAQSARFDVARVDAVETRVHLLEEVFFAVARQVDWDELAAVATRSALAAAGYPAPDGRVTLDALASHYGVDPRELKRDVDRQLQEQVHRDYAMVQEFRTGMLRLCQAQLRSGQVVDAEHAAVLDWLRGDLRQILGSQVGPNFPEDRSPQCSSFAFLSRPLAGCQQSRRSGAGAGYPPAGFRPPPWSG